MAGPTVTRHITFSRGPAGRKRLQEKGMEPVVVGGKRIPRKVQLLALAIRFEEMLRNGEARNYAEIARIAGVSRARITQIMKLLGQPQRDQETALLEAGPLRRSPEPKL